MERCLTIEKDQTLIDTLWILSNLFSDEEEDYSQNGILKHPSLLLRINHFTQNKINDKVQTRAFLAVANLFLVPVIGDIILNKTSFVENLIAYPLDRLNDMENMQTFTWVVDIVMRYLFDDRHLEKHSLEEVYTGLVSKFLPKLKYISREFKSQGYSALDEESRENF